MAARIRIRRDTTTNWNAGTPPTLFEGEFGLDTTLKQIKIGDGSSTWPNLPWLGGTLPVFASPSSNNLDDASNRYNGLYRFASVTGLTGVPSAPIDIKVADGGLNLLVLNYGSVTIQHLWTDGDGTQPRKSYTRVYESGAWKSWVPESLWAVDATEGVNAKALSLELKDTGATCLVVDGTATIKGPTILGDANADIVTFRAGTSAAPIITTDGDLNTGIYFPAADKVSVTAGGVPQITLDGTAAANDVASAVMRGGLTLNGPLSVSTANPATYRVLDSANGFKASDLATITQLFGGFSLVPAVTDLTDSASATPLLVMHYETGTAGQVSPATQDTSWSTLTWTHRFGSASVQPYINPSAGKWAGLWIGFNGGSRAFTRFYTRNNPVVPGTNNLGANTVSDAHILVMFRVGA